MLWLDYVDLLLYQVNQFARDESRISTSIFDLMTLDVTFGLSLFPRCAGLLFLRAFLYHTDKKYSCALLYYNFSLHQSDTVTSGYYDSDSFMFRVVQSNLIVANINSISWSSSTLNGHHCLSSSISANTKDSNISWIQYPIQLLIGKPLKNINPPTHFFTITTENSNTP